MGIWHEEGVSTSSLREGSGDGYWVVPRPIKNWVSKCVFYVHSAECGPSECLLLHCNTSTSRPPVRLPTLIIQADCGSIKGAEVSTEEDTEHYIPWSGSEYSTSLITANAKTLSHERRQLLSQLFFRRS